MRGFHDFIIKVSHVYNQTFTTESGVKLHADSRFNPERLANRIAIVEEIPLSLVDKTEIKKGYQIMIDPTVYYGGEYIVTGKQLSPFAIDINKGLYKIKNEMIVLFRENEQSEWKANLDNILVKYEKETSNEKKQGSIIIDVPKTKVSETKCCVVYANKELNEMDVFNGDNLIVQKGFGVPFWIDGVEISWIKNRHVLVKM